MQPAHLFAQLRQMCDQKLAIGTPFTAKAVVGRAVGAHGHHGQGSGGLELLQVASVHAFVVQHLSQALAQVVPGEAGQQRRVDAQAAQAHRHVEWRATGDRLECDLVGRSSGLVRAEQVEQRFTTH